MTAHVRAYIEAITRLRDTGRPVVLPSADMRDKGQESTLEASGIAGR